MSLILLSVLERDPEMPRLASPSKKQGFDWNICPIKNSLSLVPDFLDFVPDINDELKTTHFSWFHVQY